MRLKLTFVYLSCFVCLANFCIATTTVTGHITKLDTTTPGATAFVRFYLRGLRGNQPRITGTGAIAPQFSGSTFYVDLPADASGNISGTIYSTRDSTGTGAGDIEAGGSYTAVYYGMQIVNGGIPGPEIPVHARNGGTLDIANVSAVSTLPVVTAPTGDTTYARLDGGNQPFTGLVQAPQVKIVNAGGFTNLAMGLYAQSLINGCNPLTEYQAAQGANTTVEAMTGCVTVPNSSTSHQADGGGFYITNSSTATNAVGIYSQCRVLVNSSICWGANFVSRDVGGLTTGITLYGNEIDVNPLNATSAYSGVNGFLMSLNTTGTGTYPGNGGFYVTASANARWFVGFQTGDDAAATAGLFGATCTVGDCGSQVLKFRGFNTGSLFTATVGSDSLGNVVLTPAAGKVAKVGSASVPVIAATGTATVDLASVASGACTADSADVTLTGASVGDPARVVAATALPAGVWLIGRVTASNTGRFQLCNWSGGAVDRASDTYTISVVK